MEIMYHEEWRIKNKDAERKKNFNTNEHILKCVYFSFAFRWICICITRVHANEWFRLVLFVLQLKQFCLFILFIFHILHLKTIQLLLHSCDLLRIFGRKRANDFSSSSTHSAQRAHRAEIIATENMLAMFMGERTHLETYSLYFPSKCWFMESFVNLWVSKRLLFVVEASIQYIR